MLTSLFLHIVVLYILDERIFFIYSKIVGELLTRLNYSHIHITELLCYYGGKRYL
jgi:hypothetical protein